MDNIKFILKSAALLVLGLIAGLVGGFCLLLLSLYLKTNFIITLYYYAPYLVVLYIAGVISIAITERKKEALVFLALVPGLHLALILPFEFLIWLVSQP